MWRGEMKWRNKLMKKERNGAAKTSSIMKITRNNENNNGMENMKKWRRKMKNENIVWRKQQRRSGVAKAEEMKINENTIMK